MQALAVCDVATAVASCKRQHCAAHDPGKEADLLELLLRIAMISEQDVQAQAKGSPERT